MALMILTHILIFIYYTQHNHKPLLSRFTSSQVPFSLHRISVVLKAVTLLLLPQAKAKVWFVNIS